jgi:hypothetical protein
VEDISLKEKLAHGLATWLDSIGCHKAKKIFHTTKGSKGSRHFS